MAVYTYFKGMDELRHAVRKEGFDRLAEHLNGVRATKDPVADVAALGGAYFLNALENPHLYRFMFMEPPIDNDPDVGISTFESLVDGVARVIDSGRFTKADARPVATQFWISAHGVVTLYFSGLLPIDDALAAFGDMALNLFIGLGDDPNEARRSLEKGRRRVLAKASVARSA
jgi:AcrR family transcriptional regulator